MNLPAAYLGFLVASLMAFGFHTLRGGTLARLILYLVTAWVTFFVGHLLALVLEWEAGRVGDLHLLPGVLATVIGLTAASVLAGGRRPQGP